MPFHSLLLRIQNCSVNHHRHTQLQRLANIAGRFGIEFRAKERAIGGLPLATIFGE